MGEDKGIQIREEKKMRRLKKIQGQVFTVHSPCEWCYILSAVSHAESEPGTIIAESSPAAPSLLPALAGTELGERKGFQKMFLSFPFLLFPRGPGSDCWGCTAWKELLN